jgi:hypothetical protein
MYRRQHHEMITLPAAEQKSVAFYFKSYIKRFPSFKKIIDAWDNELVNETKDFLFFNRDNNWERNSNRKLLGVFKKSNEVYSQRILRVAEDKWKTIPKRESNIEGFNVAVIWAKIENNFKLKVSYETQVEKLIIEEYYFPFLLERVLFMNTLINEKNEFKVFNREYFLSKQDFELLNKIFNYKIQVI